MTSITKIFEFAAAHRLPNHKGRCKNLHGHQYTLEVTIKGDIKLNTGMILDFGDLKEILRPSIELFDHSYLNDITELPQPPTAENVVQYFKNYLIQTLEIRKADGFPDLEVIGIKVWETPRSYAEWRKE